jgi:hypothetical protein
MKLIHEKKKKKKNKNGVFSCQHWALVGAAAGSLLGVVCMGFDSK